MDTIKVKQAADVLNETLEKYFSFDPDHITEDIVGYVRMSLPTIQSLLGASASLLYEGISPVRD